MSWNVQMIYKAEANRERWHRQREERWLLIGMIAIGIFFVVCLHSCTNLAYGAEILQGSWYSNASLVKEGTWRNGKQSLMANGKPFDENAMTCATRLYPLGTRLLITNMDNGRAVLVTVTDRIGKRFAKTRIDLSKGAFLRLDNPSKGLIPIKAEVIHIKIKRGNK